MKNKVNQNKATLNFAHPYFVPIEDGDFDTTNFYKRNDVPVTKIAFPGRMPHYYAVFDAPTQEDADVMNRMYNNWEKQDYRAKKEQVEHEVASYDAMLENGYDSESEETGPDELAAYKVVLDSLHKAMDELTDEKLRICKMITDEEPQRMVAEELGISRRTLRERKDKLMVELQKKMN